VIYLFGNPRNPSKPGKPGIFELADIWLGVVIPTNLILPGLLGLLGL
jgi:hypothetical protein